MMYCKRPVIGVTIARNLQERRASIHEGYLTMVERHGALPVLLPVTEDEGLIDEILDGFDGFIISGGGDIDSAHWNEPLHEKAAGLDPQRDTMELMLARKLHQRHDKPVLCVCRGVQVMNVAMGGTLYQDVPSQFGETLAHRQPEKQYEAAHNVSVISGTKLSRIVGCETIGVNTLHHQAVKDVAPGLVVSAKATDGLIEALESGSHPFFLGVQWHPERLGAQDVAADRLFSVFCETCKQAKMQDKT